MIMTAAVDMKPTLTIIKAEKMDGEYQQLLRGSPRGVVSPPPPQRRLRGDRSDVSARTRFPVLGVGQRTARKARRWLLNTGQHAAAPEATARCHRVAKHVVGVCFD